MKSASLTSILLARKGAAGPSRLRNVDTETVELRPLGPPAKSLTDIPMASGRPDTTVSSEPEAGRARPIRAIAIRRTAKTNPAIDHGGRIKMSLRLDPARHARLRVMAAREGRHMQDVMSVALDRYLDELDKSMPAGRTVGGDTPARKIK